MLFHPESDQIIFPAMWPAGPAHRRCDPQVLPTGIDIEEDRRRDEFKRMM